MNVTLPSTNKIKLAPSHGIIFIGGLDEKLKDYDKRPLAWWRYIDNIFMISEHGEKELEKFLEFLNCYHSTIKFIANCSQKEINFLDISVRKKNPYLSLI